MQTQTHCSKKNCSFLTDLVLNNLELQIFFWNEILPLTRNWIQAPLQASKAFCLIIILRGFGTNSVFFDK